MPQPAPIPLGPRIVIYGPSGSGKTTLGKALADRLHLPYIELDAVYHARPNWDDLSTEDFREQVTALLAAHSNGWIIDGNYGAVRDLILPNADTAIWLRLPFHTVYRRLVWRTISRSLRHAPLWNGNRESLRQTFLTKDSMLLWGITAWRRTARNTARALETTPHHARVIMLRSPRHVRALLQRATPAPDAQRTAAP